MNSGILLSRVRQLELRIREASGGQAGDMNGAVAAIRNETERLCGDLMKADRTVARVVARDLPLILSELDHLERRVREDVARLRDASLEGSAA